MTCPVCQQPKHRCDCVREPAEREPRYFRSFGGMCWPAPSEAMGDLAWRMTWAPGETTKQDRIMAASIISAYMQMVSDPESKRRRVIRELRKGPKP